MNDGGENGLAARTSREPETLLSLHGVAKSFGDFVALHDVDLRVAAGEFLTLLGPSGCGKTTLLRIIGGFERPSAGQLILDGRELGTLPPERRPFNMVFQSYALFPHMTVWANVAYGLTSGRLPRETIKQRVRTALELVGLEQKAHQSVRELSGGQQQRVALVRAIVNEPRVLLLDEPLGALDLQLRKRMQDELRDIQARLDTTFIYVTHDQDEALSLSHRVALMQAGRIVQIGSPREVYEQPRTRFVAEFVGETNLLDCHVDSQNGTAVDVTLASGARRQFKHYGDARMSKGEPALAALRPEHLSLEAPDAGAPLQGRIARIVFHGAEFFYDVALPDGALVRVRATDTAALETGDEVHLGIGHGFGVVVRAEESVVDPAT